MRRFILAITGLIFFWSVNSLAGDLLSDVDALRKTNRSAVVDISDIVRKYIPIGCSSEYAENYLLRFKFRIYRDKNSKSGSQGFIAKKDGPKSFILKFHDEIRIIYDVEDGRVVKSSGKIIFRSL